MCFGLKDLDGCGEFSSSGSFAALRMTVVWVREEVLQQRGNSKCIRAAHVAFFVCERILLERDKFELV
jgi:hypothetical protein